MAQLRHVVAVAALSCLVSVISAGCVVVEPDDATITCDRFDSYMAYCYPGCAAGWDCVYYYDGLDWSTADLLDECADCLSSVRGTCADCTAGSAWCTDLLTTYLGLTCAW